MYISAIKLYNLSNFGKNKTVNHYNGNVRKMEKDSCEFSYYDVSFAGTTSAGKPLKRLIDITCPYRGIKIIPGSVTKVFEHGLAKCRVAQDFVNLLAPYKEHLLPTERSIFAIFRNFAELNPEDSLQNCLQMLHTACLKKLKLEEFMILDEVDYMSRKLSPWTALMLREKTTRCRMAILENNPMNMFKRKVFLSSLDEICPNDNEREIFETIRNKALFLPTSGSSKNAFIVKYSQRSEQEAVRRVFIGSTGSLEHVKPYSMGGPNAIGNLLLTSADGNRYRENMPLPVYIQRHPQIPYYMQLYMDDVIRNIIEGRLRGNETYPYKIKQKLMQESNGRIAISLSQYPYTEAEAKALVKDYERRWDKYKKQL